MAEIQPISSTLAMPEFFTTEGSQKLIPSRPMIVMK